MTKSAAKSAKHLSWKLGSLGKFNAGSQVGLWLRTLVVVGFLLTIATMASLAKIEPITVGGNAPAVTTLTELNG